jgi:hypothetical protein
MSQNVIPGSGQYQPQGFGPSAAGYGHGQPHPPSLFGGIQPAQQFDYGHGMFIEDCWGTWGL